MFLILNYTKKDIFPNLTRLPFGNLTPPWRLLLFLLWHCPPLFLGVVIKLALHLPSLFQSSRPCVSTLFIPCLGSLIQQSWFILSIFGGALFHCFGFSKPTDLTGRDGNGGRDLTKAIWSSGELLPCESVTQESRFKVLATALFTLRKRCDILEVLVVWLVGF